MACKCSGLLPPPPARSTPDELNDPPRVVFGNSEGLAVVDYLQKTLILSMSVSELHVPAELRSPRKSQHPSGGEHPPTHTHTSPESTRLHPLRNTS